MKFSFTDAICALQDLLKINSVEAEPLPGAPFGAGVRQALDYSIALMQKIGLKVKDTDGYCAWGEIGQGELFGILAHLDVVPEGAGWTYPPYGGEIHNGSIYGRGALDDKGPVIAVLYALNKLLEEGLVPKRRIRIILGCDEESGWLCMDRYKKTEEMPAMGFSPDADFPVINAEKGIVYHDIKIRVNDDILDFAGGHRANIVPDYALVKLKEAPPALLEKAVKAGMVIDKEESGVTVIAKGKSAHGAHPELGDNAICKLFALLADQYAEFGRLYSQFNAYNGAGLGLEMRDKESGALTLNPGKARFFEGEIILSVDIRHPISYNKDDITAILKEKIAGEVEQVFFHLPLYVSPDNPLVAGLLKAYNDVTGQDALPVTIGGGTYARVLPLGVAFGPGLPGVPDTVHKADEHIEIEHFRLLTRIYYTAIKNLCF
jgi:succinyl-diaminopimelate desuccinylase